MLKQCCSVHSFGSYNVWKRNKTNFNVQGYLINYCSFLEKLGQFFQKFLPVFKSFVENSSGTLQRFLKKNTRISSEHSQMNPAGMPPEIAAKTFL